MKILQKIINGNLVNKELTRLLPKTGLIITAGGTGSGKSTLSYALLEYLHYEYPQTPTYIYGFPGSKELLPKWIQVWEKEDDFPENCCLLVDEAYLSFHSRNSQSSKNKFIDKFSGLVRQKSILGIFISQTLRKLELGLLTSAQLLLIKQVPYLQVELDRSQLRSKLKQVMAEYTKAIKAGWSPQKCVYTISNVAYYEGFIKNSNGIPSFWSEELSNSWSGVSLK